MQKTGIEWTDYTSNPVKGYCPMACPYCYSRRIYDRFKWDKTIRFVPEELGTWQRAKAGSRIFVGSMIELFGDWILPEWLESIFYHAKLHPDLIFQFLTKQPQNLIKFSPFLENCWVGVTATDSRMAGAASRYLAQVKATVKFISFEPLLDWTIINNYVLQQILQQLDWVIIGAQTRPYKPPKMDWVRDIVHVADEANIPIFIKNNLASYARNLSLYPNMKFGDKNYGVLRQEMPK